MIGSIIEGQLDDEQGCNLCSCLNTQDNVVIDAGPAPPVASPNGSNSGSGTGSGNGGIGSGESHAQEIDTKDTIVYKTLGCSAECVKKFGYLATLAPT